ncbi:class I ribonucleotide reductase maintenance protein YfaE [Shewanella frigidimarina]|uniref:class I ribonucleotide reductase maintenance protein YfaE n=1 Tax=Shewanella frigidimarina TaxID=56812 RepID=UPI000F513596|nr:hypothetical protein EGC78_12005 [Shewanella frigidimarina]
MKSVTFNGHTVLISPDEVILDVLELHRLDTVSQCRDGYCGACRCKLLAGSVRYIKEPIAFLADNEILICSAVAESDIILNTTAS